MHVLFLHRLTRCAIMIELGLAWLSWCGCMAFSGRRRGGRRCGVKSARRRTGEEGASAFEIE